MKAVHELSNLMYEQGRGSSNKELSNNDGTFSNPNMTKNIVLLNENIRVFAEHSVMTVVVVIGVEPAKNPSNNRQQTDEGS